jgi:hypothetical protein
MASTSAFAGRRETATRPLPRRRASLLRSCKASKDATLAERLGKGLANRLVYDIKIDLRERQDRKDEERRVAERAAELKADQERQRTREREREQQRHQSRDVPEVRRGRDHNPGSQTFREQLNESLRDIKPRQELDDRVREYGRER